MITNIFDTEPDFINEEGFKWWIDESMTKYAQKEDKDGISLNTTRVFFVEEPKGSKTRVIIMDNELVCESTSIEGVCSYIDIIKTQKKF